MDTRCTGFASFAAAWPARMSALVCVAALVSCGGGEDMEERSEPAAQAAPALAAAAANGNANANGTYATHAATNAVANANAVAVAFAHPAHSCMKRVSKVLKTGENRSPDLIDCLAGQYVGMGMGAETCSLRIAATQGQFKFGRTRDAISVESDTAGAKVQDRAVHGVRIADVELGHVGLELSRRSADSKTIETLVLNSGERSDGSSGLIEVTYQHSHNGDIRITRCRFDRA